MLSIVSRIKFYKTWVICGFLLLVALGFRLYIAFRLPNDAPDDGRVYAQIARNVLEQHVFSHESQPPYIPSIIRLPGYPSFLAGVYALSGHGNNRAVRVVQGVVDTGTCVLVSLVAFWWMPDDKHKHLAATMSLALATVCPFTAIYVATILTEVPTNFFTVLACLTATLALNNSRRSLSLWTLTGIVSGIAVLFRPDSGLFAAAIGMTLIISGFVTRAEKHERKLLHLSRLFAPAVMFATAFCIVLIPWAVRNRHVFHVFQPLAPAHGEMPGEFVPRGYLLWLRTWVDDERYIAPVLWSLDSSPIKMESFPDRAFDSDAERDRVSLLIQKYDHPADEDENADEESKDSEDDSSNNQDQSTDQQDETESESKSSEHSETETGSEQSVEMTPEIDAQFAELAQARIARSRIRYYIVLPVKRAISLWFDTHSQYFPFEGELFPLDDLDYTIHQQVWLPLFGTLTWIYSILAAIGAWLLWRARTFETRRWVILVSLIVILRLGFFSTLENPEPRYVVEIFPFLSILGGIAMAFAVRRIRLPIAN